MKQSKDIKKDDLMWYWNSFLSGNNDALGKIYENFYHDLYSLGTTLTPDDELVKDCIQDIFFRVSQKNTQLASVNNIRAYLLTSLKNALLNTFKEQQAYREFVDSYDLEEPIDDLEEERIIAQEFDRSWQKLTNLIELVLTKRQQKIIHYRFVDELTIEEISKLLNINYQSVANETQRSFNKIRKIYSKKGV